MYHAHLSKSCRHALHPEFRLPTSEERALLLIIGSFPGTPRVKKSTIIPITASGTEFVMVAFALFPFFGQNTVGAKRPITSTFFCSCDLIGRQQWMQSDFLHLGPLSSTILKFLFIIYILTAWLFRHQPSTFCTLPPVFNRTWFSWRMCAPTHNSSSCGNSSGACSRCLAHVVCG